MPYTISEVLGNKRIAKVVNQLQDISQLPGKFLWLGRTRQIPADDEEITMRVNNQLAAADVVLDGAKAPIHGPAPVETVTNRITNIKAGTDLNQKYLNLLIRILKGSDELPTFDRYMIQTMQARIDAVRTRMEMLIRAMLADDLDYDKNGVIISNMSWGMPTALKVTVGTVWSNTASTPVTDLQGVVTTARDTYGIIYDRATMSLAAFNYMIRTTEFKALVEGMKAFTFPASGFPLTNLPTMQTVAQTVLGLTIEIDDTQYFEENNAGTRTATRYTPANYVILSSSQFDNSDLFDWGNGVVTESIVDQITKGSVIGQFDGPVVGPVGFATGDHNPPGVTLWGVARGWPRKHNVAATARLTVY